MYTHNTRNDTSNSLLFNQTMPTSVLDLETYSMLLSRIGREAFWPMRNIEICLEQMYLYVSLAERIVA